MSTVHSTAAAVGAVIFDMDGLMLDTERIARVAYRLATGAMGYESDDVMYLRLVGRNVRDTELILTEFYGPQFQYSEFLQRWRQCRDELFAAEGVQVKPGLIELLNDLQQRPIRLAVATSTSRVRAAPLLTATGLLPKFDAVVCGDEVTRGKPAPDIFLKAADALHVEPRQCLVLEDSEAGVRAAHAAGMRAIVVPDLQPPSEEVARLAAAVCASLHEVRTLI